MTTSLISIENFHSQFTHCSFDHNIFVHFLPGIFHCSEAGGVGSGIAGAVGKVSGISGSIVLSK